MSAVPLTDILIWIWSFRFGIGKEPNRQLSSDTRSDVIIAKWCSTRWVWPFTSRACHFIRRHVRFARDVRKRARTTGSRTIDSYYDVSDSASLWDQELQRKQLALLRCRPEGPPASRRRRQVVGTATCRGRIYDIEGHAARSGRQRRQQQQRVVDGCGRIRDGTSNGPFIWSSTSSASRPIRSPSSATRRRA